MQDKQMQLLPRPPRATRQTPEQLSGQDSERRKAERLPGIDQVLSTRDIERITGRHRCTIYRWVCAGTFPKKRAGGGRGWLRSDIERWLSGAE
jgi:predicted DNA-binding transcriptional regulator AlpA